MGEQWKKRGRKELTSTEKESTWSQRRIEASNRSAISGPTTYLSPPPSDNRTLLHNFEGIDTGCNSKAKMQLATGNRVATAGSKFARVIQMPCSHFKCPSSCAITACQNRRIRFDSQNISATSRNQFDRCNNTTVFGNQAEGIMFIYH